MSHPPKTIVVGVDFSNASVSALDEAIALALAHAPTKLVPLLALTGGHLPPPRPGLPGEDLLIASADSTLRALVADRLGHIAKERSGAGQPLVSPRVTYGEPVARLVEEATAESAWMVVVGTHGRSGLERLVVGSVAEQVVRRAPCAVLVVKPQHHPGKEPSGLEPAAGADRGADDGSIALLSEPHIDGGAVVLRVLDQRTGQPLLCEFDAPGQVRVEAVGRGWVTRPTSEQRARAARAALTHAHEEPALYGELFDELARRQNTRAQ